jgi:hypothetical protein
MTERQREALMLLARLQMQDHDRAVCANALFSAEHWKHNAGNDWPDVDDGSFTAFENCVHPDCALVRTALLQAQDSQPAQAVQPSNHPACVAGPADALETVATEFVLHYTQNGGCSHCGGTPHTKGCFVGRTEAALDARMAGPADAGSHETVRQRTLREVREALCRCPILLIARDQLPVGDSLGMRRSDAAKALAELEAAPETLLAESVPQRLAADAGSHDLRERLWALALSWRQFFGDPVSSHSIGARRTGFGCAEDLEALLKETAAASASAPAVRPENWLHRQMVNATRDIAAMPEWWHRARGTEAPAVPRETK